MIRWIIFFGVLVCTYLSFAAGPAKKFMEPDLFRIIFFHLPCAFISTIYFFVGAFHSWKVLKGPQTEQLANDVRAVTGNEMAMMMAMLTMITGILFSRVQWGGWWVWDPRQTSFLLVLLLYGAYFALRAAISDEQQRARVAAAYSVMSLLPALFLIFALPRLMESLHPNDTLQKGAFDKSYWLVILPLFVLLLITAVILHRLAITAGLLELKTRDGNLETAFDGPAPTGVVRHVSVSSPDRGENEAS